MAIPCPDEIDNPYHEWVLIENRKLPGTRYAYDPCERTKEEDKYYYPSYAAPNPDALQCIIPHLNM